MPQAHPPSPSPETVDTRAAALVVGLAHTTLATLRSRGGGPPYLRIGRAIRYRVADLRQWRDDRATHHSTAEYAG